MSVIPVFKVIAYAIPMNGDIAYIKQELSSFKNIKAEDDSKHKIVPKLFILINVYINVIFLPNS